MINIISISNFKIIFPPSQRPREIVVTRQGAKQAFSIILVACPLLNLHTQVQASLSLQQLNLAPVAVCLSLLAERLFGFYSRGLTLLRHLTPCWFEFLLAARLGLAAPWAILFFICFGVTNCDPSTAARLKPS